MKAGQAVGQVHEATRDQAMGASGTWDVLSEALGLWRGDPLVDVPSQMLVAAEVPPLDALRMQALEWRMDAGLAQGRHAELVGELTQLARDHPPTRTVPRPAHARAVPVPAAGRSAGRLPADQAHAGGPARGGDR